MRLGGPPRGLRSPGLVRTLATSGGCFFFFAVRGASSCRLAGVLVVHVRDT